MEVTLETAIAESKAACLKEAGVEKCVFAKSTGSFGNKPAINFMVARCFADRLCFFTAAHCLLGLFTLLLGNSSPVVPFNEHFEQKKAKYVVLRGHTRNNFDCFL